MVQNLQPGAVKNVAANEIRGTVHIYRTGQGYSSYGNVGWQPNGGQLQILDIAVGETVSFQINGAAGMLVNGCPSMVQLLWQNQAATDATNAVANVAGKYLKGAKPSKKTVAASLDPAQQAMQTLTSQWYNAIVSNCGLDPNTFQLIQGAAPLGSTSEQLWNIFDVVPPLSVSNYYNPSQLNVFSADYGAVINNLIPQNSNKFQTDMGDYYSQWVTYLKAQTSLPAGGVLQLFQTWSAINMPPNQAQTCYTDYQQIAQGAIPTAVQMWINSGGAGTQKAYNATIAQLNQALPSAPSKSFVVNSSTESSDISHTWAKVEMGGFYDFFEGGASSEYDSLTMAMSQAGLSINVSFQRLLTFTAAPLSKTSTDPILSQYQPWYNSSALNIAYQTQDNTVWNNTHPNWNDTFGPNGNMLRTTSGLVIADGITISMTSNTGFSSSQQTQFKAAAEFGFFPFFEASGSGGWEHNVTFDTEGNVTITSTSQLGNPNVIGAIVTPIGGVMMVK
jgi:hypothetical protein